MQIITNVEQGSADWLALRLGVATASRAAEFSMESKLASFPSDISIKKNGKVNSCLYRGKEYSDTNKINLQNTIRELLPREYPDMRNGYIYELAAEVCTAQCKEQGKFKQTEWGHEYEDAARATFELVTGLEVETVSFIYKDENKRFGISPDGLIKGQKCGLELKCPFDSKVFVEFVAGGKIKPEYIEQCQFSMWVTGFDAWYFASYDPRMNCSNLHYVKIERDESYMKKYDRAQTEFIRDMDNVLNKMGVNYGDQWKEVI